MKMKLNWSTARSLTAAAALACVPFGAPQAVADEPGGLQVRQLMQRIEQQEARIAEMDSLLRGARVMAQPANFSMLQDEDDESEKGLDIEGAGSDLTGTDERLEDLEGQIESLTEALSEITDDKTIVHSGSSNSTMQVSGRVHFDTWSFLENDPAIAIFEGDGVTDDALDPQNRIGFRRVRFGVKGDVTTNMTYKIEMEFAGGNDVEFRDVYLGWEELPILQELLLGNQKRPYGLDHLNSSRYNVFVERPFVIEAFNQDARRLGLQSYGVSDDLRYNWRYGVFTQRNVQGLGNYIDDHIQGEIAGRFANTIWYDEVSDGRGYAHWAVSGTIAEPSDQVVNGNEARFRTRPEARSTSRWLNTGRISNPNYYQLLGLESVINVGPTQIVGEYQQVWLDRLNGSPDLTFGGGYAYISYFLTGEHMPWDRETGTLARPKPFQNFWVVERCNGRCAAGWGAWQIAARWSYADFNDRGLSTVDGVAGGVGESVTLGLNWYWNANARMQFNYIYGDIDDREVFNAADVSQGLRSGDYHIIGTRWMIDF